MMADLDIDCDHVELRAQVRELCINFPDKYWQSADRHRVYPTQFVEVMTRAGFLSILIPKRYGGGGQTLSAAAAILEEIQRSGGNSGACHAQMYIMGTLLRHGSEELKQQFLPKIASGELRLQAFGVTEAESGTDTTSISTFAERKGNNFILNGQKIWISRTEHSDFMLLLARTKPKSEVDHHTQGLSVFLIDLEHARANGMTVQPLDAMTNHAATTIQLNDVVVPATNLVGEEGKGFRYIMSGMNAERILVSAEAVGDCKWFIEKARNYANERQIFNRRIGQNQGIQFPIARAYAQMRGAQLAKDDAIRRFESGEDCGAAANIAKLLAADASSAAADACMQTFGGLGFASDWGIERKFRETRIFQMAPVSSNMILAYIAEHVLGLPRSY